MQTVQLEPVLQFNPKGRTITPSGTQHFLLQGDLANILALQSADLKTGFTSHRSIVSNSLPVPWTGSRLLQGIASRYGYDPGVVPHGISLQSRCGDGPQSFDLALLAGIRRKNATRETTNALKTWLNEHRKNPYPTKGEKIMLAILTKMTLTQVSTWFANARRRLKKENKMTWLPKNKSVDQNRDPTETPDDSDADLNSTADDDYDMLDDVRDEIAISETDDLSDSRTTPSASDVPTTNSRTATPPVQSHAEHRVVQQSPIVTVQLENRIAAHNRFDSGDSPVTSLRRWVDDCFNKDTHHSDATSVTLTPPQTPVDRVMPQPPESSETTESPRNEHKVIESRQSTSVSVITSVERNDLKTTEAAVAKALETSPFQLTTNREMDAVLALTTLCSR